MRKLLLFFAMLCVSVGAWADIHIFYEGGVLKFYDLSAGDLSAAINGTYSGSVFFQDKVGGETEGTALSADELKNLLASSKGTSVQLGGGSQSVSLNEDDLVALADNATSMTTLNLSKNASNIIVKPINFTKVSSNTLSNVSLPSSLAGNPLDFKNCPNVGNLSITDGTNKSVYAKDASGLNEVSDVSGTLSVAGYLDDVTMTAMRGYENVTMIDLSGAQVASGSSVTTMAVNEHNYNQRVSLVLPDGTTNENLAPFTSLTNPMTVGVYSDNSHKELSINTNSGLPKGNLERLASTTSDDLENLKFVPQLAADGSVAIGNDGYGIYMKWNSEFMSVMSGFKAENVDFNWVNISDLGYDFSGLSEETHHIIIPASARTRPKADGTEGEEYASIDNEGAYTYPSSVYTVSSYKNSTAPYNGTAAFNGHLFEAGNNPAVIVYERTAGDLADAMKFWSTDMLASKKVIPLEKSGQTFADSDWEAINTLAQLQYVDASDLDASHAGNMMTKLSSSTVEYVALPDNYSSIDAGCIAKLKTIFPSLKAGGVYDASPQKFTYQSYEAGSLETVLNMIESMTKDGATRKAFTGELVLSGKLNAYDITVDNSNVALGETDMYLQEDGHFGTTAASVRTGALSLFEAFTRANLSNAVFETQTDMNFAYAGWPASALVHIDLPNVSQTIIPAHCLQNFQLLGTVDDGKFYIPGRYEEIRRDAFHFDGEITHIYTDGTADEEEMGFNAADNGNYSITLPPALKSIGTEAFWGLIKIANVYVTSTDHVPTCAQDAFDATTYYGYGGDLGPNEDHITRYQNPTSHKAMAILHWPKSVDDLETIKCYTDVLREYTRPAIGGEDYPGDYDEEGNLLAFPRQSEYYRSFYQAILGYVFTDWDMTRNPADWNEGARYEFVNDNFQTLAEAQEKYPGGTSYDKEKYCGWHQFVLNGNFSFITRMDMSSYKENDWYTICMPYDLTKDELLTLFGAQYEEGKETKVDGVALNQGEKKYPKVVTLTGAKRDKENLKIYLHLSKDLLANNVQWDFDDFSSYQKQWEGRDKQNAKNIAQNHEEESKYIAQTNDVVIRAGYPYLIKPYLSDEDLENAQAGYRGVVFNKTATAKYPYYTYRVVATNGETGTEGDIVDRDDNKIAPSAATVDDQNLFTYHFVGSLERIDGGIPQNAYYLGKAKSGGKHKFFKHTSSTPKNWSKNACIILANLDAPTWGQHLLSQSIGDWFWKVDVSKAKDDSFKDADGEAKMATFDLLFDEGEVTGIREIESTKPAESVTIGNGKVYSVNGQYVGNSLNGLSKGMYIVNGKKYVVK